MGGQLTAEDTINMPANVAVHACEPCLAAAFIAQWPRVINCHVEVVRSKVAVHGVGVGLTADVRACGCLGGVSVSEEVYQGCGGSGRRRGWVKGTGSDVAVGELQVIEGEDIKISY